jgi:hypothetical protein
LWLLLLSLPAFAQDADEADPIEDPEPPPVAGKLATPAVHFDYQFSQVQRQELATGATGVAVENGQFLPKAGAFPLHFFIDNTRGAQQTITLSFSSVLGNSGTSVIKRTIEVQRGERLTVTLPVPVEMRYGQASARGAALGRTTEASLYFTPTNDGMTGILSLSDPDAFEGFLGIKPSFGSADVHVTALKPEDAPTELAAYVGFDGVVVPSAQALEALNEAQRRALEAYVASGGVLTVRGPFRSQAAFPLLQPGKNVSGRYGFGQLNVVVPGTTAPVRDLSRSTSMPVKPQAVPAEYQRRYGGATFTALLPQATAPLGQFLLIITLFTLAIGPGSVLIARRRGPAMLLLTIPATATVTCVLILGWSLAADGFVVHTSSYGYTLLDRKSDRAITLGVTGYYANLAPSSVVFPSMVALVGNGDASEGGLASIEWRDGARYGGDFVASRVYREWGFIAVEPTRARMQLKQKDSMWVVQNALGGDLAQVQVDIDGVTWEALNVRDGSEKALYQRSQPELLTLAAAPGARFRDEVRSFAMLEHSGQFVALMEGQGFVPTGGVRTSLHEGRHVIIGEVDGK